MTNEMIILLERVKLMEEGKLKGTGEMVTIEFSDGLKEIELPEEIHTFAGWKNRGFSVRKGEKASIKFPIWKYTEKKKPDEELTGNPLEDAPISNMFLKDSCFFTPQQVEPLKRK